AADLEADVLIVGGDGGLGEGAAEPHQPVASRLEVVHGRSLAAAAARPVAAAAGWLDNGRVPGIDRIDRKGQLLTLGACCFGLFMVMLDNTVVNVALPSIQRELEAWLSGLALILDAYILVFA